MKGYVKNGMFMKMFREKCNHYNYKVYYKYFEKGGDKILFKRVMHISKPYDAKQKAEMLKKVGFEIELFQNDIYLRCDNDKHLHEGLKIGSDVIVLNLILRCLLSLWLFIVVVNISKIVPC